MSDVRRNSCIAGSCSSIQRASVSASAASRQTKHDARVIRSATTCVGTRPTPRRPRAALHRRGQPALGVRERHDDVLVGAPRLDDVAVVGELVRRRARPAARRPRRGSRRPRSRTPPRSRRARGRPATAPSRPSASRRARDRGRVVLAREVASAGHAAHSRVTSTPMPATDHRREGAGGQSSRGGGRRGRRARPRRPRRPCSSATTPRRTSTST